LQFLESKLVLVLYESGTGEVYRQQVRQVSGEETEHRVS